MAQHLDKQGKQSEAMETIDEAIKHTPTVLELYMVKARIYKVATCICLPVSICLWCLQPRMVCVCL